MFPHLAEVTVTERCECNESVRGRNKRAASMPSELAIRSLCLITYSPEIVAERKKKKTWRKS